jgi:hypothetical protein
MLCSTAPKAFFVLFANFTVPSRVFSWGASGRCSMGAYGAGMSVYSSFIARAHEVVFPKKTSIDWDRARNRRHASLNHSWVTVVLLIQPTPETIQTLISNSLCSFFRTTRLGEDHCFGQ